MLTFNTVTKINIFTWFECFYIRIYYIGDETYNTTI